MRAGSGGLSLLNVGVGGFVFSFFGALLAIGVSYLFTMDGDNWVVFSAVGAALVSMWGWLYRKSAMLKREQDAGPTTLEGERIP